jgi:hypothetical protein
MQQNAGDGSAPGQVSPVRAQVEVPKDIVERIHALCLALSPRKLTALLEE